MAFLNGRPLIDIRNIGRSSLSDLTLKELETYFLWDSKDPNWVRLLDVIIQQSGRQTHASWWPEDCVLSILLANAEKDSAEEHTIALWRHLFEQHVFSGQQSPKNLDELFGDVEGLSGLHRSQFIPPARIFWTAARSNDANLEAVERRAHDTVRELLSGTGIRAAWVLIAKGPSIRLWGLGYDKSWAKTPLRPIFPSESSETEYLHLRQHTRVVLEMLQFAHDNAMPCSLDVRRAQYDEVGVSVKDIAKQVYVWDRVGDWLTVLRLPRDQKEELALTESEATLPALGWRKGYFIAEDGPGRECWVYQDYHRQERRFRTRYWTYTLDPSQ